MINADFYGQYECHIVAKSHDGCFQGSECLVVRQEKRVTAHLKIIATVDEKNSGEHRSACINVPILMRETDHARRPTDTLKVLRQNYPFKVDFNPTNIYQIQFAWPTVNPGRTVWEAIVEYDIESIHKNALNPQLY